MGKVILEGKIDGKIEKVRQKRNWESTNMTIHCKSTSTSESLFRAVL